MGTTGPTAQAAGAEDWAEVRAILGRGLVLAGGIAGVLLVLQVAIADFAFWMVEASGEVEELGRRYFLIRVWAAPAALATYVIIGWFYGLENARIPLILQIAANGINVVLDLLFVFGFGWGVEGVAIASVIAEFSGLALGLYFVRRHLKRMAGARSHTALLDLAKLRRLIFYNGYIFFRTLCVVTGMAVFMAQGAKLGDVPLAANQVLFNFLQFTAFGLDGFANAAEALIGDAIGRRNREAFRRAVRSVLLWAGLVAGLNVVIYWIAGTAIIALMTNIPEVRAAAAVYLPWVILMPAVSVWAYTYDGIYLGAMRADVMLVAMLVAFAVYMSALFLLLPVLDNHGLWLALTAFLSLRGIMLIVFYPRLRRAITLE
jgi:MATE family multidrug resistance protein